MSSTLSVRRSKRHFISEAGLSWSPEILTQLLETTKILVWEAEPEDWRFTYVSEQAVKMLGYPLTEWYEPDFLASHIYCDDEQRALSIYREHSQLADHYELEFRIVASDGHIVWLQNLVSITRENDKPTKVHGFMIDISERKSAEAALQELGGQLITAQEEERSRIARELHDGLNQRIALLSIALSQIAQETHLSPSLLRSFWKLQGQVQEISGDVHRLCYKLHPSKLDHLGLAPAVKSLCEELSETLKVELKQTGFPATVPQDVTLCAFRIVQEALRNCVTHSGARTVNVNLEKTDEALSVSVSDDGCGFDIESEAMKKGLGFISMRERLHLVGGTIQIQSHRLRGTQINVLIPLNPHKEYMTKETNPHLLFFRPHKINNDLTR